MIEMKFCRRCGAPLQNVERHIFKCDNGHTLFANPSPTTAIYFITDDNRHVIMSVRGREPGKGMLDAFGGFLDDNESLEECAVRELEEELGLSPADYDPLNYFASAVSQYEYAGESQTVVGTQFWTRLKPGVELVPSDDVADTKTVPLQDVDLAEMHADDIRHGIRELRKLFPANPTSQ